MTRVPSADRNPALTVRDGHVFASSREIAETFGKDHRDVLKRIDNLLRDMPTPLRIFAQGSYTLPATGDQQHRCYEMTRDGFALLAMGFTGRRALAWKLKYIEAFNAMEAELARLQSDEIDALPGTGAGGGLTVDELRAVNREMMLWHQKLHRHERKQLEDLLKTVAAQAERLNELTQRQLTGRHAAGIMHSAIEKHISPAAAASLSMHTAREVAVMVLGSEGAVHRRLSAWLSKELDRYGRAAGRCWQQGNVRGIPDHLSPRTYPIQGISEWLTGPAGGAEMVRTENDRLNRRDQDRKGTVVEFPQHPRGQ